MRKTLAVMAIMMFSIGAFADCTSSYLRASEKRDKRTKVLGITAMVGSIAGIAVSAPAGIILGGYLGGYTAFWGNDSKEKGNDNGFLNNKFDKLLLAFTAAKNNVYNKYLDRLIQKSVKKSNLVLDYELREKARIIITEAFEQEVFCPVINVKGKNKVAVFNKKAVVKYVSSKL